MRPPSLKLPDGDADGRAIDRVVGDHGAFEGEFRIERDLAHIADAVARYLDVRGRVAAHRGIVAVADAVAPHDHVAGAERVDGVAVLAGAAGACLDVLDAVVRNQRAVVADRRAQDLDAVVIGALDRVARHDQAECVERYHRGRRDSGKDIAGDIAGHLLQPDAVTAAVDDLALADADIAPTEAMHQATPRRQRNLAAIERDAAKPDMAFALALQHRGAAVENQPGRAAHADELGTALQAKHSSTVDARRQCQRRLCPRRIIDRALQIPGLVVGAAGPHAILRDVAAQRGDERRRARSIW